MSNNKEYNGWSNYETWCVNLWLDNDQGIYHDLVEYTTKRAEDLDDLAQYIEGIIEELNPVKNDSSLFSDLITSSLGEVDWDEIAQCWLDEYKDQRIENGLEVEECDQVSES